MDVPVRRGRERDGPNRWHFIAGADQVSSVGVDFYVEVEREDRQMLAQQPLHGREAGDSLLAVQRRGELVVEPVVLGMGPAGSVAATPAIGRAGDLAGGERSEERRVGKECRSRWSTDS